MPKVRFINEQVTADVPAGAVLRDVAINHGVEIYRGMWTHINCLGNGLCGRCQIWIATPEKAATSKTIRERFHRLKGSQRLACQVRVMEDLDVRTRPIGPAVVLPSAATEEADKASYKEAAEQRYRETMEAEAKAKAEAEAKAKAKAEAEAKAKAEEEKAKAIEEAEAKAKAEAAEDAPPSNGADSGASDQAANTAAASPKPEEATAKP